MTIVVESVGLSPGANSANCIIVKPTGVALGNLLIASISREADVTITPPSGWTLIKETAGNFAHTLTSYKKIATATEVSATDFTFTLSSAVNNIGGMLRLSGARATVTYDTEATTSDNSVSFSPGAMGTHNLYVVVGGSNNDDTWTEPTGATERVDENVAITGFASLMMATAVDPSGISAVTRSSSVAVMNVHGFFLDEISTFAKTVTAKARVRQVGAKTIQAKAKVKYVLAKTITAKGRVRHLGIAKTISIKARMLSNFGQINLLSAKARIVRSPAGHKWLRDQEYPAPMKDDRIKI